MYSEGSGSRLDSKYMCLDVSARIAFIEVTCVWTEPSYGVFGISKCLEKRNPLVSTLSPSPPAHFLSSHTTRRGTPTKKQELWPTSTIPVLEADHQPSP